MAFGRGKAILLGEHGVVYGHPALAAGLEVGVTAFATDAKEDRLFIDPWDVEVSPADTPELAAAFRAVRGLYPERPVEVRATVALPAGAGLGCSAALGVGVVRALDAWAGETPTDDEVAERALRWERVFHGNPSGIDNTMAARGGLLLFQHGAAPVPVRARNPIHLVIGNSGSSSSTRAMVDDVARQRTRSQKKVDGAFEAIAAMVKNGVAALERGELKNFGQLMDMNHALLASLMLSTNELETMCQEARSAGALGAKLTGAGGGGCMVALAPNAEKAHEIVRSLGHINKEAFVAQAG
ncbi:MAG: mevalonate kinase [Myxococcota bacterium]